jgi:hypothetical protein
VDERNETFVYDSEPARPPISDAPTFPVNMTYDAGPTGDSSRFVYESSRHATQPDARQKSESSNACPGADKPLIVERIQNPEGACHENV